MEDRSWTFDEETHEWVDEYGVRYSEDRKTILRCSEYFVGIFYVPRSVTSIGDHAFSGCSSLQEIKIPNSVSSIGEGAFFGCSSLQEIKIPNSATNIGEGAFFGCSSLQEIKIPNLVTSIGDWAFYDCSNLKRINIPILVSNIGKRAFAGCSNLQKIEIPQVDIIEEATFANCARLKSVYFSNKESVKSIGKMAFSGCSCLDNIDLPDSVTRIEEKAFSECSSLNSINVPTHITYIGKDVFFDCSRLKNINNYNTTSVTSIELGTFSKCARLEKIELPSSVKIIDDCAFAWCSSLKGIIIHEGITRIGNSAFYGCFEFRDIIIPQSVEQIGEYAFYGCPIKEVRLPHTTTYHPNSFNEVTKVVKAKVFISYSWDDDNHKDWVRKLAEDLQNNGVSVILDQWDLELGDLLPNFMEKSISEADKVIIIMTPNYKKKANKLVGGVGYEYSIITTEILDDIPTNKFIPVLRKGSFKESSPITLYKRISSDMSDDSNYENGLEDILRKIFNKPKYKKPPLGEAPNFD